MAGLLARGLAWPNSAARSPMPSPRVLLLPAVKPLLTGVRPRGGMAWGSRDGVVRPAVPERARVPAGPALRERDGQAVQPDGPVEAAAPGGLLVLAHRQPGALLAQATGGGSPFGEGRPRGTLQEERGVGRTVTFKNISRKGPSLLRDAWLRGNKGSWGM